MKNFKFIFILIILLAALPAAAQEDDYPLNTITVIGTGDAIGAPDVATLETGVESRNEDVAVAFAETNQKIEGIINALVEIGIAREDIRTSGLNIWQDYSSVYGYAAGPPPFVAPQPAPATTEESTEPAVPVFVVSNNVSVTIRDIALVTDVVNMIVNNGATNLYGVYFSIDDRTAMETEARADAFADALERATQLATLSGVELGDVLIITENYGGYYPSNPYDFSAIPGSFGSRGDGSINLGATIEPGQLSVSMQIQVVLRINH